MHALSASMRATVPWCFGHYIQEWHLTHLLSWRSCNAGNDQAKHDLALALPHIFAVCKEFYVSRPDMTGADLYDFVCKYALLIASCLPSTHCGISGSAEANGV